MGKKFIRDLLGIPISKVPISGTSRKRLLMEDSNLLSRIRIKEDNALAMEVVKPLLFYLRGINPEEVYSVTLKHDICETSGPFRKVTVYNGNGSEVCSITNSRYHGTDFHSYDKHLSKKTMDSLLDNHTEDYVDLMWSQDF